MTRAPAIALALAAMLAAAGSADAQPAVTNAAAIAQARTAGLVGERFDGYLGLVGVADAQLLRQVNSVNILRRALYADLSARRGVSQQEVGITAACQLLATVAPGERYMLSDNVWRLRTPDQAAPAPDYCR